MSDICKLSHTAFLARNSHCGHTVLHQMILVSLQELDTTLQVLGIDGDVPKPLAPVRITTSVHAPLVDDTPIAARRSGSVASSSVFFSPRAGFGRTPSEAGLR